ncbi:MAG: four helix bundle protein [Candidatus Edwardsbacteria bacterium]
MFKFERLEVWKKAIAFADKINLLTEKLPQREQFSLGEQLRRASLSIPTNIAEGTGRDGVKEARYFYPIAKGSVYEVANLLVICRIRKHLSDERYEEMYEQADEIAKMLTGLRGK